MTAHICLECEQAICPPCAPVLYPVLADLGSIAFLLSVASQLPPCRPHRMAPDARSTRVGVERYSCCVPFTPPARTFRPTFENNHTNGQRARTSRINYPNNPRYSVSSSYHNNHQDRDAPHAQESAAEGVCLGAIELK